MIGWRWFALSAYTLLSTVAVVHVSSCNLPIGLLLGLYFTAMMGMYLEGKQ